MAHLSKDDESGRGALDDGSCVNKQLLSKRAGVKQ